MIETPVCPECEMEFDWPGVELEGELYCCEPCAQGEECTCPQHGHEWSETDVPLPGDTYSPGPI